MIKLDIVPVPKPRMTRSSHWNPSPSVARYWQFKDDLEKLWCGRSLPEAFWAIFTMPMPNSWSERKKISMDGQPHKNKADADNLGKAFQDCLYKDDSIIWDVRYTKYWGRKGSIHILPLEPLKTRLD